MRVHSDIKEFFKAHDGHIFRYWIYKKMFTPYEQEEKFIDETIYEDEHCSFGRIIEVSPLPDGDVLLAFQVDTNYEEGNKDIDYVTYHKLSEIQLDWSKQDQVEYEPNEEETNNESVYN